MIFICNESSRGFLFSPFLQLRAGEKDDSGAEVFPAAIPVIPFLSDGQSGVGEEDGSGNRHADVNRLGRCLSRSRFCSARVVGVRARVCSPSVSDGGARLPGSGGRREPLL